MRPHVPLLDTNIHTCGHLQTRILVLAHSRMEFSFLKLRTNSHKFRAILTQPEINAVLDKFVHRLRSIQILNIKEFPEVQDEYHEEMDRIVADAREALKDKLRNKIKKKQSDLGPVVIDGVIYRMVG